MQILELFEYVLIYGFVLRDSQLCLLHRDFKLYYIRFW